MKLCKIILAVSILIFSLTAAAAAEYILPFTEDLSPDENANFNGGSVIDSGKAAVGGYNRFGNGNSKETRPSGVRITSASGNRMLALREENLYKITQTKKWATENASGDDGDTGTSYKSGGVSLAYTESNGSIRMGFNSIGCLSGNIYNEASLEIDLMLEKGDFYVGGYDTAFDKNISLYNSPTPTSANEAAFIKLYHESSFNDDEEKRNKYMAVFANSALNATTDEKVMLNFGEWYSFKMQLDVPKSSVTYSITDANGITVKMYTSTLLKESEYIVPVISVQDLQRYGFDFYIKNIKVVRETLAVRNITITHENGKYIASAEAANDVFALLEAPKAPVIVFMAFRENGLTEIIRLSEEAEAPYKKAADNAPEYSTVISAELTEDEVKACTRLTAILWSDIFEMNYYGSANIEINN